MRTIFLDTVGLLALWDESDQWHAGALVAFNQLVIDAAVLTTTSLVLAEAFTDDAHFRAAGFLTLF